MEFIGSNHSQVKGISPTDSSRKHELHKPLGKIIITLYIVKPFTRQNSPHSKVFGFKVPTLNSEFKISGDMTKPRSFYFRCKRQNQSGTKTSRIRNESGKISSSVNVV